MHLFIAAVRLTTSPGRFGALWWQPGALRGLFRLTGRPATDTALARNIRLNIKPNSSRAEDLKEGACCSASKDVCVWNAENG